jgi:hypothetical protein
MMYKVSDWSSVKNDTSLIEKYGFHFFYSLVL